MSSKPISGSSNGSDNFQIIESDLEIGRILSMTEYLSKSPKISINGLSKLLTVFPTIENPKLLEIAKGILTKHHSHVSTELLLIKKLLNENKNVYWKSHLFTNLKITDFINQISTNLNNPILITKLEEVEKMIETKIETIDKLVEEGNSWKDGFTKILNLVEIAQPNHNEKLLLKIRPILNKIENRIDKNPAYDDYLNLIKAYTAINNREKVKECVDKINKKFENTTVLTVATKLIEIGALESAEIVSNLHLSFTKEDKINFYSLLACNYLLNDYLEVKDLDEDFGLNAKRVLSTAKLIDEETSPLIFSEIILLLQNFPNIITSPNVKNRVPIVNAHLIAKVIFQKSL